MGDVPQMFEKNNLGLDKFKFDIKLKNKDLVLKTPGFAGILDRYGRGLSSGSRNPENF